MTRSVLVLGFAAALLLPGCGGAGREVSERLNLALLARLPVFPGAEPVAIETRAIYDEDEDLPDPLRPVKRWTLLVTYSVPRGTGTLPLLAFYRTRLHGWHCSTRLERVRGVRSGTIGFLSCRRAGASVRLNADNLLAPAPRVELVVEAHGAAP